MKVSAGVIWWGKFGGDFPITRTEMNGALLGV